MSAQRLCVYTVFDDGKPLATGILNCLTGDKRILPLWIRGTRLTLHEVDENSKFVAKLITKAIANQVTVVTAGFKDHLAAFNIPLEHADYSVYDLDWVCSATGKYKTIEAAISRMLDRMATVKVLRWQKIFANAAVVYQALENKGVKIGGLPHYPIWSQETYSGRSKNLKINIQGADGDKFLSNSVGSENDLFVYFDWVAADLRVASIMSEDKLLQRAFDDSDPYTTLSSILTDERDSISRSDCKISLLKAINSFDVNHVILTDIFKDLGRWLRHAKDTLERYGYLQSILGRKFHLSKARDNNPRAVLNGVMQGSVAHGMQNVVKGIWDYLDDRLLLEIHDSVAVTCESDNKELAGTIAGVVDIMSRPFAGVLDSNPFFPVKVSAGYKFRSWEPLRIYRCTGVEELGAKERAQAAEATEA